MDEYGRHNHPHTHAHMNVAQFADHVRRHHRDDETDVELDEEHDHTFKVKEDWNHAARIDVNPLALDLLEKSPPVVYFGIEGSFKGAAMISAVLRTNENASVISVPAVGMWECPELEYFVQRYLMNCTIVIVPDGDWINKKAVIHQARCLQGRLLGLGCKRVLIASTPLLRNEDGSILVNDKGKFEMTKAWDEDKQKFEKLKGVDDYLGLGKGLLCNLDCVSNDPPEKELVYKFLSGKSNVGTMTKVITKLALMADREGCVQVGCRTMANIMGVSFKSVQNYLHLLESHGAIKIHGNLETKKGLFGVDWDGDKPRIEIVPGLRATEQPIRPLGEVLQGDCSFGSNLRLNTYNR